MIISPKDGGVVPVTKEEERPLIMFLCKNGTLLEDDFVRSEQNVYTSTEDWQRYGKIERYSDKVRYYLKQWRGGRPGEVLVDPRGVLSKPEDMSAFAIQRGHRFCEYVPMKKELFEQYVEYLRSGHPTLFKGVEQAILNGENR